MCFPPNIVQNSASGKHFFQQGSIEFIAHCGLECLEINIIDFLEAFTFYLANVDSANHVSFVFQFVEEFEIDAICCTGFAV